MITVRFRNMWEGFSPDQGGLPSLIRHAAGQPLQVESSANKTVDLEVCSVFPSRITRVRQLTAAAARRVAWPGTDYREFLGTVQPSSTARASIWYTGENVRPPSLSDGWSLTLSFDPDSWPRNAYLPLWLLHTDTFGAPAPGFLGSRISLDRLSAPRAAREFIRRPRFACAFIRNPQSTRISVIEALGKIGEVDVFGPYSGRPVPDKASVARDYRFMVCLESDLYPGYVTEKPIEAWAAGCVPLWWGLDRDGTLNRDALVNLATAASLETFLTRIQELESDREAYEAMWRQPILADVPSVDLLLGRVRDVMQLA